MIFLVGYVHEIKEVLFTKTKNELKKTLDDYMEKETQSLTSQFTDRLKKVDAVSAQKKRKSIETPMHPPCKNKHMQ